MQIKHGFSMMELMVAMAISSIVMLTAYAYYGRNVSEYYSIVNTHLKGFDEMFILLKNSQKNILNPSLGQKRRAYRLVRPN